LSRRIREDVSEGTGKGSQSESGESNGLQAASLEDLAEVVQTSDSRQVLHCAECGKPMVKERFHPMIPVVVDRCRACGYIWLDAGELPLLRRLYVELMTSDDPEICRRREKVAIITEQWENRKDTLLDPAPSGMPSGAFDIGEAFDLLGYLLRAL
jgi:Zn-finger nucleic acid-binding protein